MEKAVIDLEKSEKFVTSLRNYLKVEKSFYLSIKRFVREFADAIITRSAVIKVAENLSK